MIANVVQPGAVAGTEPGIFPSLRLLTLAQHSSLDLPLSLASASQRRVINYIWSANWKPTCTFPTLCLAEALRDEEMMGAAYYRALMEGLDKLDPRLESRHRTALLVGRHHCAELWQRISHSWTRSEDMNALVLGFV